MSRDPAGRGSTGRGRPTVLDVARTAGVSTATVSRVMNGAASVDAELVRRVRSAVAATGYVPNVAGRMLRNRASTQIAVLVPDADNPYFTQVVGQVETTARTAGYSVMLCHSEGDLELEQEYLAQIIGRQLAGVIAVVANEHRTDLRPLVQAGIPTVLVDRRCGGMELDCVSTDNADAGRQAAAHLRARGFRQPVALTGPAELSTTEDRVRAFQEEWVRLGGEAPVVRRVDTTRGPEEDAAHLTRDVLSQTQADCLYATNNRISAGAFEALRGTSAAPALLATDDDLWTRLVTPSVSVVQQPIRATGRLAARMLGERISDPGEPPRTTLLRARIVERESTQRR